MEPVRKDSGREAPGAEALGYMTQPQLQQLFRSLRAPQPDELDGAYRGRLLTTAGMNLLPSVVKAPLLEMLQGPYMPWRGKRFEKGKGANYWLKDQGGWDLFEYDTLIAPALDGSGDVFQLDYDVESNPRPARRIVGEVRKVSDGLYLARMNYKLPVRSPELLYFTLEKQD